MVIGQRRRVERDCVPDYHVLDCCLFVQIFAGVRLRPLPPAPSPPAATPRQRGDWDGEVERGRGRDARSASPPGPLSMGWRGGTRLKFGGQKNETRQTRSLLRSAGADTVYP